MYEILVDEEKRRIYDETGVIAGDDEDVTIFSGKTSEELYHYFRKVYKKISKNDIEEYEVPILLSLLFSFLYVHIYLGGMPGAF